MYSVIDLFAGAGGLSLGFTQTGKFDVVAAFENNKQAKETYERNNPEVDTYDDVRNINYGELKRKYGEIDVVIGGPPCQGFSNANRQKSHAISTNNMLVKGYVSAVINIKPSAFVMENVNMLKSKSHRFYESKADTSMIKKYSVPTELSKVVILDKPYVNENLCRILLNSNLINNYIWAEKDYKLINIVYKKHNNIEKCADTLSLHRKELELLCDKMHKRLYNDLENTVFKTCSTLEDYYSNIINEKEVIIRIEKAIMIQRALRISKEIIDNELLVSSYDNKNGLVANIRSYAVLDYLEATFKANGYNLKYDTLCAADFGAPQKRNRFVIIGVKNNVIFDLPKGNVKPENYATVKDAIYDIENINTVYKNEDDKGTKLKKVELSNLAKELRDSKVLKNHIITATKEVALKRFKKIEQGENFHSLDDSMKKDTYTNIERTQNTIYLRLDYLQPSGTVVNVRKSMWIHPVIDRAISVREAARLQTFPDSFVFKGTKDSQYQQVGNAVPPFLAKAIAEKVAELLDK